MKLQSNKKGNLADKSKLPVTPPKKELLFSFRDFDINQGQRFEEWYERKLLHVLLERIKEFNKMTRMEAERSQCLKIYGNFPVKSGFKYPAYISEDAEWGSFRIGSRERIAGHMIDNVFYVVFLDRSHQFWPSEKRNT